MLDPIQITQQSNQNNDTGVDSNENEDFEDQSSSAMLDDLEMLKKLKRARELVFNPHKSR